MPGTTRPFPGARWSNRSNSYETGNSSCSTSTSDTPNTRRDRCKSVGDGFDLVETVLSRVFGGCCRPREDTLASFVDELPQKWSPNLREVRPKEPKRRRRSERIHADIAQPPEIRRLAMAEERQNLYRSRSLDFLFHQDGP